MGEDRMSGLPASFSLSQMMTGAMPEDLTLGQMRTWALSTPELQEVARMVKSGRTLGIRFLRQPEGDDLPDSMTLRRFRELVAWDRASISIDDGSGGQRVLERA